MVLTVEKETALPEGVRFLEGDLGRLPVKIEIALPEREARIKVAAPSPHDPDFLQKIDEYENSLLGDTESGNYKKYLSVSEARGVIRRVLENCFDPNSVHNALIPIHEKLINIVDHTANPFATVEIAADPSFVTVIIESKSPVNISAPAEIDPISLRGRGNLISEKLSHSVETKDNQTILKFRKE